MPNAVPSPGPRDFPDWVSPIVVKELRQGLRQNTFVLLFIFLQAIMAIVVFASLAGAEIGTRGSLVAGQMTSGFFFFLFALAALVVQPLRGMNALAGETRGGTIDLLLLTRLDSWRITFGKWLALVSQTGLLLVSILPYLIMRYYLGGMQLFGELMTLFSMFVFSVSLTGVAVGLSSMNSVMLRVALPALLVFLSLSGHVYFWVALFSGRAGFRVDFAFSDPGALIAHLASLGVMLFIGYYSLEMSATQIAPPAENRSTRKRLLGLAMMLVSALAFRDQPETVVLVFLVLSTLLTVDCLAESPKITASVVKPFLKYGGAGRLFGRMFYPGWPSGICFVGLLAALCCLAALHASGSHTGLAASNVSLLWLARTFLVFCNLLLPALILAAFGRRKKVSLNRYMLVAFGAALVTVILTILADALDAKHLLVWFSVIAPPLGVSRIEGIPSPGVFALLYGLVFLLYWYLLFIFSRPHRKRISEMERPMLKPAAPPPGEPV